MIRNEITLQKMFSMIVEELRENGRWGTAHIYQATSNAFSAFVNNQPLPLRKLSPTVLKRFENHLRQRNCSWNTVSTYIKTIRSTYNQAVDMKYVRYVPRLFEHVYTGTCADRKKALETSDISYLVRETEMRMQETNYLSNNQRTRVFFVLMFMLRGIPFVDLAYLHKRDLQGNVLSYRRRKTGRALTVALTPEVMQLVRLVANRDQDSPYLFPILQSEEGSEAAYREYQSALRCFNQRLSSLRQSLGMKSALSTYAARHTWATMAYHCEIHPGIISEAMGHSSIAVTETYLKPFSNKKIDEANRIVISFVRSGGCLV
ncbi:site-specific integrase [Bacteroides sp. GD17]|jgi:integrase|uniref:tyrosine-type recombinase/integrase n=1 Tax=Bacteroides sp. GD17 TaxID=3139826 RepID=UPI00313E0E06